MSPTTMLLEEFNLKSFKKIFSILMPSSASRFSLNTKSFILTPFFIKSVILLLAEIITSLGKSAASLLFKKENNLSS